MIPHTPGKNTEKLDEATHDLSKSEQPPAREIGQFAAVVCALSAQQRRLLLSWARQMQPQKTGGGVMVDARETA